MAVAGADQSSFPGIRHAIWAPLRILTDITDSKPRAKAGQGQEEGGVWDHETDARQATTPRLLSSLVHHPSGLLPNADEQRHHRIRGPNPLVALLLLVRDWTMLFLQSRLQVE